jgi:branched-chain amino acid transport system substrate-binding protein
MAGPGYFEVIQPASIQDPLANFTLDFLKARQIIIFTDTSIDSRTQTGGFEDNLQASSLSGAGMVLDLKIFLTSEFQAALASVAKVHPDLIYLSTTPFQGGQLAARIRSTPGLEDVPILGNELLFSPAFLQSAGESARGIYLIGPDFSGFGSHYPAFLTRYRDKYGQAPLSIYHAFAYDATQVLLNAIRQSSAREQSGLLVIPRSALGQAILQTHALDGLTGSINCNPWRSCYPPGFSLAVYQIIDPNGNNWQPGINPKRVYP